MWRRYCHYQNYYTLCACVMALNCLQHSQAIAVVVGKTIASSGDVTFTYSLFVSKDFSNRYQVNIFPEAVRIIVDGEWGLMQNILIFSHSAKPQNILVQHLSQVQHLLENGVLLMAGGGMKSDSLMFAKCRKKKADRCSWGWTDVECETLILRAGVVNNLWTLNAVIVMPFHPSSLSPAAVPLAWKKKVFNYSLSAEWRHFLSV